MAKAGLTGQLPRWAGPCPPPPPAPALVAPWGRGQPQQRLTPFAPPAALGPHQHTARHRPLPPLQPGKGCVSCRPPATAPPSWRPGQAAPCFSCRVLPACPMPRGGVSQALPVSLPPDPGPSLGERMTCVHVLPWAHCLQHCRCLGQRSPICPASQHGAGRPGGAGALWHPAAPTLTSVPHWHRKSW